MGKNVPMGNSGSGCRIDRLHIVITYNFPDGQQYEEKALFQQQPELANFIFRLNALEDSLKEHSILIFDQHTPPFDLFKGGLGSQGEQGGGKAKSK